MTFHSFAKFLKLSHKLFETTAKSFASLALLVRILESKLMLSLQAA